MHNNISNLGRTIKTVEGVVVFSSYQFIQEVRLVLCFMKLICVCPHTVTSYTSLSFWSCCCQIAISGQASTGAAVRPRCSELAGLLMTHPQLLTLEEAVKAVMWILIGANDLFVCLRLSCSWASITAARIRQRQCLVSAASPVEVI